MKKTIYIILLFLLSVVGVRAEQQTTTDHLTGNDVVLDIANKNTVYLEVSLQGNTLYTAYGVDIVLPEGVFIGTYKGSWDYYMANGIYPTDPRDGSKSHQLRIGNNVAPGSPLVFGCMSMGSDNLLSTSGALFYVGLVLTDKAKVGQYEVKFTNVLLTTKDAVDHKSPDTTARLIITDTTGIEDLGNADDTSGAIYSVEGVKVDAPQKGHVYIVDGKKMKF